MMLRPAGFPALLLRTPVPYGWWVAGALFVLRAITNGASLLSFGLFVTPLSAEFGWSRAEINATATFILVTAVTTPLVGRLIDRFGARICMLVALPVVAALNLGRAGMTDLWQFYLTQLLINAFNLPLVDLPIAVMLSNWYVRKRGRMVGLALMGANFGGVLITPLVAWWIAAFGWRWAYAGLAMLLVGVALPLAWLVVRDRPSELGLQPDDGRPAASPASSPTYTEPEERVGLSVRQALRTRAFWLCGAVVVLSSLTFAGAVQQVVPHLEAEGIDRGRAAFAFAALSFFGMAGKLGSGWLTDRLPARRTLQIALAAETAGLLCLIAVAAWTGFLVLFVPLFGFGYASLGAVTPLLTVETFGNRAFASIHGTFQVATAPAIALAMPLIGLCFDELGSYSPAFAMLAVGFAIAILLLSFVRPVVPPISPDPMARPAPASPQQVAR